MKDIMMLAREVTRRFQPLLNMLGKWEDVRVVDRASKNHDFEDQGSSTHTDDI